MASSRNVTVLASAARTTDFQSPIIHALQAKHISLVIDITAVSGTSPTLDVDFQQLDSVSGKWITLLSTVQLNATGTTRIQLGHGLPVTANVSDNKVLPHASRLNFTFGGTTPSFTFSVGATLS